jgi:hypothetical protein
MIDIQVSEIEKNIYNLYLKYSRHGMPYMPRKDFSDISPTALVCIKKLNQFFSKFKHIKPKEFFEAPIILHPDEKYPDIKFFITRGAIKTYSLSIKIKESQSPENQIESIKEGIHFITMFCVKNSLQLHDYINHKTKSMPTWMQHYREHRVNPYILVALGDLNKFKILEEDEKRIWAGDFFDNLDSFTMRYHNSTKAKEFMSNAFSTVKLFLKKELQYS